MHARETLQTLLALCQRQVPQILIQPFLRHRRTLSEMVFEKLQAPSTLASPPVGGKIASAWPERGSEGICGGADQTKRGRGWRAGFQALIEFAKA